MPRVKQFSATVMRAAKVSTGFNPTNANILSATTAVFTQQLEVAINSNINKLDTLESQNLNDRISALETAIALLVSHTHNYEDDNGTSTVTKTTESN